jgi:hypothetical protein
MLSESCLFPAPPEYQAPEPTPPFLWDAIPATTRVQVLQSNETFKISVKLKSEDAGHDLWAFTIPWYLVDKSPQVGKPFEVKAGTFAEERTVEAVWIVPELETSCLPLSLVVSHDNNFKGVFPKEDSDAAVLTWWLAINGTDQVISDCISMRQGASP